MMFKTRIKLSVSALILLTLCLFILWHVLAWYRFLTTPLNATGKATTIIVPGNMTLFELANEMSQKNILSRPRFFITLAHWRGDSDQIRSGEYEVDTKITPNQLLDNLVKGKVYMRKITLIEGVTLSQIKQVFLNTSALQKTIINQSDQEIAAALGCPYTSPEGLFFPDTYVYTWGNKDFKILRQAYMHMQNFLNEEWTKRADDLPYSSPYQALIVASLIESETHVDKERPLVAGVILQRLKKQMYLQIDPTVLYGVNKPFGSKITQDDLHNDNPYNTYRRYGLPPTPIDIPSAPSIQAALHPLYTDALYYVARGDGTHTFSATYQEHRAAIKENHNWQEEQKDLWQVWIGRSGSRL